MGIKAFVFDCGGVLLNFGDRSAYEVWEERLGLEQGKLAGYLWESAAWRLAERGELSDEQYWLRVGKDLGLKTCEEIAALHDDLWNTWVVDQGVLSLIDRVREHYSVAMLSNSTDALEDLLEHRYQVADRFEMIINSARLGVAKPDRRIYEEALRRLEAEPGEVVFVDDRAENIAAAAALGMHVIWFIHAAELERQLAVYLNHRQIAGRPTSDYGVGRQ